MCIGIPMRVLEALPGRAVCEARGGRRLIDMSLVGEQPPGTWLLTFLDAAREVITAEQAALVTDALQALDLAVSGQASPADIDRLFPDLANREPQLPAHLYPAPSRAST
jgi:hydrogenase expression/formation protein HypC